ncbi:hypothetical protein A2U01_0088473, partial [Trifolium medium]|nr:hypothetical protein [Trifolium medium]
LLSPEAHQTHLQETHQGNHKKLAALPSQLHSQVSRTRIPQISQHTPSKIPSPASYCDSSSGFENTTVFAQQLI